MVECVKRIHSLRVILDFWKPIKIVKSHVNYDMTILSLPKVRELSKWAKC